MRLAYADPPYPGLANLYAERTEVDHADLIASLEREYDGWALSTHVPGLRVVVPLLPERARICAWVKPWVAMRPGARLQYAWEPVIIAPARQPDTSLFDWVRTGSSRRGRQLIGAKPDELAWWIFAALGARPGDDLVDLYPGTGAVGRAWSTWSRQRPMKLGAPRRSRADHLTLDVG